MSECEHLPSFVGDLETCTPAPEVEPIIWSCDPRTGIGNEPMDCSGNYCDPRFEMTANGQACTPGEPVAGRPVVSVVQAPRRAVAVVGAPSRLPDTGTTGDLLGVGAAFLAVGAVLARVARRRRAW